MDGHFSQTGYIHYAALHNDTASELIGNSYNVVTVRLIEFNSDLGRVVSTIELTVLQDVLVDGAVLECRSEDLASQNVTVFVNTSGDFYLANS